MFTCLFEVATSLNQSSLTIILDKIFHGYLGPYILFPRSKTLTMGGPIY